MFTHLNTFVVLGAGLPVVAIDLDSSKSIILDALRHDSLASNQRVNARLHLFLLLEEIFEGEGADEDECERRAHCEG